MFTDVTAGSNFAPTGFFRAGLAVAEAYDAGILGQKVLGSSKGDTAFDDLTFPTRPLYSGNPWFLRFVVSYYQWRDGRA